MTQRPWWHDPTGENEAKRQWGPKPKWVQALLAADYSKEQLTKPAEWSPD